MGTDLGQVWTDAQIKARIEQVNRTSLWQIASLRRQNRALLRLLVNNGVITIEAANELVPPTEPRLDAGGPADLLSAPGTDTPADAPPDAEADPDESAELDQLRAAVNDAQNRPRVEG